MVLTLKGVSKNGKKAVFTGATAVVTIPVSAFVNGVVPQQFAVQDDVLAVPVAKTPKVKETREEREARLALLPKPTLAEKIAKREAALQKLRDKAAREAAAAATE